MHTLRSQPWFYTYCKTPLGSVLLLAEQEKLIGLYLDGHNMWHNPPSDWIENPDLEVFQTTKNQLMAYFQLKIVAWSRNYLLLGTDFQKHVWHGLMDISYGLVVSYKNFAAHIGFPHAVRSVASAVGKNPLSIVLPCHRIVRSNGSLGGYNSGVCIKHRLLALEQKGIKQAG